MNKKAAITKVTCSMCHPRWEQASSQQFCHFWCQKSERNPNDKVESTHNYWNEKICLEKFTWWKPSLNPRAFACFENSPKCSSSCPSLLHQVVRGLDRQIDFVWHFSGKKSTYWGYSGCPTQLSEMRQGGWMQLVELYEGDL